jgi:3D (Asp-Asp-Asp) domain-containing protein
MHRARQPLEDWVPSHRPFQAFRGRFFGRSFPAFFSVVLLGLLFGCRSNRAYLLREIPAHQRAHPQLIQMEVTGYCSCGACTGWKRDWRLRPVVSSGPSKGKPKRIGITASGTRARPGTIAADTRRYPFGTIVYVPGYGYGRVEDRGGAIRGNKLDVYFRRHSTALDWGRQTLPVKVWIPSQIE